MARRLSRDELASEANARPELIELLTEIGGSEATTGRAPRLVDD